MAYCIFESIQKWILISSIQVIAMNNVKKDGLKTSKQCKKILSKSVKVRTFWETHKIWNNLPHGFDKSADLLLSIKINVRTMRKIFSIYVCFSDSPNFKIFISFQCNTRISNSKCSLLCTILCSMLRTSIFVQMYVNTRAGLRAHLSTPVYYYVLHTGQCIVVAGQPRHVSFLNIHGFRPGFMTFNIRMCFATIHNGTEVFLEAVNFTNFSHSRNTINIIHISK